MSFVSIALLLIVVAFLVLVIWMGYLKSKNSGLAKYYFPALIFKVICGVLLGLVYTFYYDGGDTFSYYDDALLLLDQSFGEYLSHVFFTAVPYGQRSVVPLTKITSLVLLFTGKNYWLASVVFSAFSFFGAYFFVYQISVRFPKMIVPAVLAFLFFPSAVFWSSGILKESLVFGMVTFMSGVFLKFRFWNKVNVWQLILAILFGWLMLKLKYYIAGVFLPLLLILTLVTFSERSTILNRFKKSHRYLALVLVGVSILFWATTLQYNLHPQRIFSVIKTNQTEILALSASANSIHYIDETSSSIFIPINLGFAFLSGMFRPLIPHSVSATQLLTALENWTILILFLFSLKRKIVISTENKILICGCLTWVVVLATLLAYSTPNFGTLARYKVYYMPFFLFLLLWKNPLLKKVGIKGLWLTNRAV